MTWFNQVKKEEGVSCAWTDAAAHSKKDSENVAAPNTLNILTIIASPYSTAFWAVSERSHVAIFLSRGKIKALIATKKNSGSTLLSSKRF